MTRFSSRAFVALAAAAGLASVSLPARAEQPTSDKGPATLAPVTVAEVAGITPVNLAGVLNYCVETNLVSHDDGDAVQTALNTKTDAVPMDHAGNMDYAIGTAGQFVVSGKTSTITGLDQAAQGKVCSAVLTRSKSMI